MTEEKTSTGQIENAIDEPEIDESTNAEYVWVCKSSGAKKYHTDRNCSGLRRCKKEIGQERRGDAEAVGLQLCSLGRCQ